MTSRSDDNTYYVNEYGVRAKNQWVSVENENSEDVNGEEVDTLWYYFGDNGKAYKATAEDGDDKRKKTCPGISAEKVSPVTQDRSEKRIISLSEIYSYGGNQ